MKDKADVERIMSCKRDPSRQKMRSDPLSCSGVGPARHQLDKEHD